MSTLPRSFSHQPESNKHRHTVSTGATATAMPAKQVKKSKRLSWTLGRKKSRDEPYVADGSGKS